MSIKPILFNTDMVRAILDGRKIVTRRLVKPQPTEHLTCGKNWEQLLVAAAAPYQPGDILYVRETWCSYHMPDGSTIYEYRASDPNGNRRPTGPEYDDPCEIRKWRPSIHMPKEAARIWLKVKDVRVERLQDITVDEIRNEGLTSMAVHAGDMEIALSEWKNLWNSTIKKSDLDRYGWNANPWVWVIEFERCEKPENI